MYADLFDQLGRSRAGTAANATAETPPAVAFKAGTFNLESSNDGAFTCTADTNRNQVRLLEENTELKWQVYDRRRETVLSTEVIPPGTTFTKVPHDSSRIYVWTRPASTPIYKMYWMQDADDTQDDEIVTKVNEMLQQAVPDPQVDTLSSILENLGMPQQTTAGTTTNQLTLADLQGAMAGIQEMQTQTNLSDIITNESIQNLLDDEAVRNRLLQFLPEHQQSEEYLRENLTCASVRRSLMLLSNAIADEDTYASVIANFQLDAIAGQDQLAQGNPIAAFLDCITASVQAESKEEDAEMKEESKDEKEDGAEK